VQERAEFTSATEIRCKAWSAQEDEEKHVDVKELTEERGERGKMNK
jgi:hypothetical protein